MPTDTRRRERLDVGPYRRTTAAGDTQGRMSATTVLTYRKRLRDYATPAIGRRKLSELGKGDVLRIVDRCHEAALSELATHGVLTAFRTVLRFARERDAMITDPFVGVPRDRLPARRVLSELRALRPEDAALLLGRLGGKRDYTLGCLLVDAGLRVSDVWAHLGRRRARRGRSSCPRPACAARAGRSPEDRPAEVEPWRANGATPPVAAGRS